DENKQPRALRDSWWLGGRSCNQKRRGAMPGRSWSRLLCLLFLPDLFPGLIEERRKFYFRHTTFGKPLPHGGKDFIEGERLKWGSRTIGCILLGKLAQIPFQREASQISLLTQAALYFRG